MKPENTKKRLLLVLDYMKKTDVDHPLNCSQLIEKLERDGISTERKSISRDMDVLKDCGYDIIKCENHNQGWYMINDGFQDHEIKMLVDAIANAKFLTIENSRSLIKSIKRLATKGTEKIIDETLIIDPELKLDDKMFGAKFDTIMRAITDHKQIKFQYQEIGDRGQRKLRYDGYVYTVNPYYIVLSGEEYYLMCNPSTHSHMTFFRIEMMTNVNTTDEPARPATETDEIKNLPKGKTIADYLRKSVNMWDGQTVRVTLKAKNRFRMAIKRKFGQNVTIRDDGTDNFVAHISVANTEGFYYWLASYGPYIKIEGPEDMRTGYIDFLKQALALYE